VSLDVKIKVLIADDSMMAIQMIKRILNTDPQIEVVGIAHDGFEAKSMHRKLQPDLILMDIHMPGLDGIAATKIIMQHNPVPILMVTATVTRNQSKIIEALSAGALEAIETPAVRKFSDIEKLDHGKLQIIGRTLLRKVHALSKLGDLAHMKRQPSPQTCLKEPVQTPKGHALRTSAIQGIISNRVIAIGCSTGGPNALKEVLKVVPADCPAAILIVQHMEKGFTQGLANWLNDLCAIRVVEARADDMIVPGTAYVAKGGMHLKVTKNHKIELSSASENTAHQPSVDVLFKSLADVYGNRTVAMVLTGMGSDGAEGLGILRETGAVTLAQDKKSSIIYGMPMVAAESGAAQKVLPLSDIMLEALRAVT
jgi:two-component system chemotaxis response regulator CheB